MKKHLLGLEGMTREEIEEILDKADEMRALLDAGKKDNDFLRGKCVVTMFYENSTRTRTSFVTATKYCGAMNVNLAVGTSSVQKGESLIDTAHTLESNKADAIIIRHQASGAAKLLADNVNACVINAGDGMHEHPTQALLDLLTMRRHFGKTDGLNVSIIGDIKHSRVARSNIYGLQTMGAKVTVYGPKTLIPTGIEQSGARVATSIEDALTGADVVMGLRIQLERQEKGMFPSIGEYAKYYGINTERLKLAKKGAVLMHPMPVNRGVEMTHEVCDCDDSLLLEQVTNGVAVRMAILTLMLEDKK